MKTLLKQAKEKLRDPSQELSEEHTLLTMERDLSGVNFRYNELTSTPILLLMICVLYEENKSLPDSKTKIYETIRELAMDRTTLKTFGCKSSKVKYIAQKTSILGKFAWEALQKDIQQLLLNKVDLLSSSDFFVAPAQ